MGPFYGYKYRSLKWESMAYFAINNNEQQDQVNKLDKLSKLSHSSELFSHGISCNNTCLTTDQLFDVFFHLNLPL